jgi:hypothetical protein
LSQAKICPFPVAGSGVQNIQHYTEKNLDLLIPESDFNIMWIGFNGQIRERRSRTVFVLDVAPLRLREKQS